jgi:hypothetical protein
MTSVLFVMHILGYLPLDMQNGCNYSAGVYYSPAGSDKICVVDFSLYQCAFACACPSRRLCGGGHSSIAVGHNTLDKVVLLIQCHVADIMMEVALSADVTSLATVVAGFHNRFEGPSAVDVHRNPRRECMRRGVHCCRGCGGGGM